MTKENIFNKDDIPVEGSLGLLALGAVGVIAWRKKRKETGYIIENTNFKKKSPDKVKKNKSKK